MRGNHDSAESEPFFQRLRADIARQFAYDPGLGALARARLALTNDSIWAMGVYRLGRALRGRGRGPGQRLAWAGYRLAELAVRLVSGIHLDVDSRIGPGFFIGHFSSIHVGPGVTIGAHCSIGQMCFIGAGGPEAPPGVPTLGDRVYLGVGAKVLGGVRIGDGAAVAANAVVLQDVPPRALVLGNPARVISYKGSEDFLGLGPRPPAPTRGPPPLVERRPNVVAARSDRMAETLFGSTDGPASPVPGGHGRPAGQGADPGEEAGAGREEAGAPD